jgi:DNA polymerase (family 10)
MAKRYDELSEQLDELSLHFRLEGRGRLARDCQLASAEIKQVDFLPPDPSDLDGVSTRVRDFVAEFRAYGEIPKLTEMREKHPYLSDLTRVKSLGPKTARDIYEETGVETLDGLQELLDSGEIEDIHGIGSKTATTFRRSLSQLE